MTMSSYRSVMRCSANTWTDDVSEPCWDSCSSPLGQTTTLDAGDCKSRPLTACDPGAVTYPLTPTAQKLTDDSFNELVQNCSRPFMNGEYTPYNNEFQVSLADGCPTSVSITYLIVPGSPPSIEPTILDCVMTALGSLRWACATELACMVWAKTI